MAFEQPAEVVRGRIWSKFVLETARGQIVVPGFAEAELQQVTELANSGLRDSAVQRIDQRFQVLQSALGQVSALLSLQHYVKASARVAVVDQCRQALKLRRDRLWMTYATVGQKADYNRVQEFVQHAEGVFASANERFCEEQLSKYAELFDTIESRPLTPSQRLACVRNEENNLVLAGAGTGKTSTMIGRAGYLLASGSRAGGADSHDCVRSQGCGRDAGATGRTPHGAAR